MSSYRPASAPSTSAPRQRRFDDVAQLDRLLLAGPSLPAPHVRSHFDVWRCTLALPKIESVMIFSCATYRVRVRFSILPTLSTLMSFVILACSPSDSTDSATSVTDASYGPRGAAGSSGNTSADGAAGAGATSLTGGSRNVGGAGAENAGGSSGNGATNAGGASVGSNHLCPATQPAGVCSARCDPPYDGNCGYGAVGWQGEPRYRLWFCAPSALP